jgi:PAS domain S-box-containing protein
MTARWIRKKIALGAAVAVLALSLAVSFYRAFDERMLREQDYRGNPLWVTTQAEHALSQFGIALHRFAERDPAHPADSVRLQFDLLWSRLDLLQKEAAGPLLSETPEVAAAARTLSRLLHRIEGAVTGLGPGDAATAEGLLAEVERQIPEMRKASIAVNVANRLAHARARGAVRGELAVAALLALGVLLAGGVLLTVAVRESRTSQRLARKYEVAARELAEARDELEQRVEARTQALTAEVEDRRRKEVALRESEDRYRQVIESFPDAIWIHRNGIIRFANPVCAEILGVASPDDLIGRNALEFVHEEDLEAARKRLRQATAAGAAPPRDIRFMRADGAVLPVEAALVATSFEGQASVMSVWRDVSQRAEAEDELRRSEQRLAQALKASGDGLWEWNIVTGATRRSPRCAEIVGSAPEELGGDVDDWNRLVHPDDRAEHDRAIQACVDGETAALQAEYRVRGADGGWVWVLSQGRVVDRDRQGRALRVVGTMRDMTDRRREIDEQRALRDAAESANAAKNQFLANMSHELRTPLNAVLGFSDAMRLELSGPLPAAYKEYARDIHRSGTHLLELIGDLLDISAIESGVFKLSEALIDVPALMGECLRLVGARAAETGVAVTDDGFDIGDRSAAPALLGDERRVRQILLNGLSAALKRTPEGGTVSVSAALDKAGALTFSIADDGITLSAEAAAQSLDLQGPAFGEAGGAAGGPGIGLPLCRTLAEAHGGAVRLAARAGGGNVLDVCFPSDRVKDRTGGGEPRLRVV